MGGHEVDDYIAQVYEIPFVIMGRFTGRPMDIQSPLMGELPDIPLQALEMGMGGNGSDDEKICPDPEGAKIHHHHIPAFVLPKDPPQGQGGGFIVHR
jgi:hypothetical protein